jgi:CRP-like cAMP-binding protein
MSDPLQKHIERYVNIDTREFSAIQKYFEPLEFAKKQNLVTKDQVCKSNYFVVSGCLRMFFITDKGNEQTIDFALENWWMSDYDSFGSQKSSEFSIQAVEKTKVLSLTHDAQEEMLEKFPVMERYFRLIHQRAHAAYQSRVKMLYVLSREELYYLFVKRYPEFANRVPQYLLASFLGFTPEYLSEIRAKKRS